VKKFILNIVIFFSIPLLIFLIGIILPATPRAKTSLLFAQIQKDSLLHNVKSPRIIFIGGSSLSFGINSKMIKDSLGVNPINTAIHLHIGLIYMIDHTLPFIESGDIVVVAPEYEQFYGTYAYGRNELLRTIFDINPSQFIKLRKEQWINIIKYIPKYSLSKFNPYEYFFNYDVNSIYGNNSFNEYGDAYKHWKLKKEKVKPAYSIKENFNYFVINELLNFKKKLQEKRAVLYITFPGYQATSFEKNRTQIIRIESELKKKNLLLLGNAKRYKIPYSMFFDTEYHLSKEGLDLRTHLLIEDLKKFIR
jgi:hypothetical protein